MKLDQLALNELERVVEQLATLRHDLGKYIYFECRFLAEDAAPDAVRSALCADVLATRTSGSEVETAMEIWTRLRPEVLADDPDVALIDRGMTQLADVEIAAALEGDLPDLVNTVRQIAATSRRLHQRARKCLEHLGGDHG